MQYLTRPVSRLITSLLFCLILTNVVHASDPLPSWNNGDSKESLIDFVDRVTEIGGDDFVAPGKRIATFDNDGTLWSEKPMYYQFIYVLERIKELAPDHPEWKEQEPFASVLKGDFETALGGGETALAEMVMATHAGMTVDEFSKSVSDWLSTARHPKTGKLYTSMVFQPMLELLDYLRANDFKVFIVSGGGIDFLRVFSEKVYGIPPERVVGSSIDAKYEIRDGKPVIVKLPEIDLIDDKAGKPVGIQKYIGRKPIMAVGNSDGDFEMLEWTTAGDGLRLGVIVHHTDADREWAYDRDSHVGKLDKGLDQAAERNWKLIDMKKDWKQIYPSGQ
jgi:phosphoglycolate phosphatase-like HAD superfamily hydrolase